MGRDFIVVKEYGRNEKIKRKFEEIIEGKKPPQECKYNRSVILNLLETNTHCSV